MTESTKPQRIEIGFDGGQVIAARLAPKQFAELRNAVETGDGWHDLATEDGEEVAVNLGKVVFVRGETGDHSVGFSGP